MVVKPFISIIKYVLYKNSPPNRYAESGGESRTSEPATSTSSSSSGGSSSGKSGRAHTNMSNYSTTESTQNERQRKPLSVVLSPRVNTNSVAFASKPNVVYSKSNGTTPSSSGRTSGYFLKSKIERTRNKAMAVAGELGMTSKSTKMAAELERETSSESLKVKMKRSESYDAKNNLYCK